MRTPEQLQTEYDQLAEPKPDQTDWMIEQLLYDIQHSPAQLDRDSYIQLFEHHVMAMLMHLLEIIMAAADPEVREQTVNEFVKYATIDKLSRIHSALNTKITSPKLFIPKKGTTE